MMKDQDKLIKHISLIKFKDPRVIQSIVYHPFLFAKRKMTDPDDYRPIRIRYFGVFVGKYMRNKEIFKKYSYIIQSLKANPELIKIFIDPTFSTDREARKYVVRQFKENNKEFIEQVYDAIYKAIEKK